MLICDQLTTAALHNTASFIYYQTKARLHLRGLVRRATE